MIVVGMNDPTFANPRLALHPRFFNSAGRRLWQMSGVPMKDWMKNVERKNVLSKRDWNNRDAKNSGARLRRKLDKKDDTVFVLGRLAWIALKLPVKSLWLSSFDKKYILLPHPSGKNLVYNDPAVRKSVGFVLQYHVYEKDRSCRRRQADQCLTGLPV